jgi:carboxyl-terminal processing protease
MKKLTLCALISVISLSFNPLAAQNDDFGTNKIEALLYHINKSYVDSVDNETMVEDAIKGILNELDPHSSYIPADELIAMNEPLKGNFEGVGIQFNIFKDTLLVVQTISGGPSEKVGLMAGDQIMKVDGENIAGIGLKNTDVMKLLKGPKGTVVNVSIKRGNTKKILEFEITRDKIPIYSVDAGYMANPNTGYIKVNRFAKNTVTEFNEALDTLREQGMKNLILDLQGNGGGYLRTAKALADEFLKDGDLLVFTQGRSFPKDESFATSGGSYEKGKLIVLIDKSSASASEIVAGAIQDHDRGLIIGRRSFGKGLVQKPVQLPDGSAVRLTTQRYYTPAGRCIQKSYEEGVDAYRKEKYERLEKGELSSMDSIIYPDSLKFFTANNRVVYGGGGIMPDLFVPIDTTMGSEYYYAVVRKGAMNSFALDFVNKSRSSLIKELCRERRHRKRSRRI